MKLTITRPTPEDAQELNEVAFASKKYWGYPDEWFILWQDDMTITPQVLASRDFYVGENKKGIVFIYSISKVADGTCELEDAWIAPPFIGQGFGRLMFDHIRLTLKAINCTRLLIVSDPNAEGFYLKMGAERIGERLSKPDGRMLPLLEYKVY